MRALITRVALVACATLLAWPAAAAADEPDLVAQWHLDARAQGYTPDSSGHGHDGEVNGVAPKFVAGGRFDGALDLGGPGARVDVLDSEALEPRHVTALAWVKADAGPGPLRYVLAKGGEGCRNASYALYTGASGGLAFYVSDGVEARLSPEAGAGLWDGRWHAVAGTFDGVSVRLYVDGAEVGSGTPAAVEIAYGLQSRRLNLGNYPLSSSCPAYETTWPGLIDEARIYTRALSGAEIAHLHAPAHTAPPSLPAPTDAPTVVPTPTPTPTPTSPAPLAAPRVIGVQSVAPIVAGRAAVLSAQVQGDAQRLEWDFGGDGKTDVSCDADQPTLRFRASTVAVTGKARAAAFSGQVSVRAVGATGTGPASVQSFAVAPATSTGSARLDQTIADLVAARAPVYACGSAGDLGSAADELTFKAVTEPKFCRPRKVLAGTLMVEGCLQPVRQLADIPLAERGIVQTLARALKLPVAKGSAQVELSRALDLTDSYLAVGPVVLNGVTLEPHGDARIVIYSQLNQIVSSDAVMAVGGIRLEHETNFTLDTRAAAGGLIPVGAFKRAAGGVRGLGAFPLSGDVRVVLTPGGSEITTELELPSWLSIGGGAARNRVKLRVTGDGELVLDDLHIGPLDAELGPLGISDLTLDYSRARGEWKGQGKLCVIACLDAVERPGEAPPGGVVIRDGELVRAFVNLDLPGTGIPLFPGVFLTRVGAGVGLNPTRFLGGARVNALGIFRIDGTLVLAMPSDAAPFHLTREESGGGFPAKFYDRTYPRFTLALGGEAFLKLPLLDDPMRLAGGYMLYHYPGYVAFGGDIGFNFLDIISLDGHADGEFNAETGRFNFGASIHACVLDVICGGAIARVSSVGIGACVSIDLFLGEVNIGGGVQYSPFAVKLWPFDGCKWSRFDDPHVFNDKATAAQAGAPFTVDIEAGDRSRAIRLDGTGGAPRVRVTTPGGEVLDAPDGPGLKVSKGIRILRSERLGATVVGLVDPAPGAYTVETLPGSAPVKKVTEAEDPPDARATATVRGTGARRTLVYDIAPRPDQRVTFVEVSSEGNRPLGSVRGGRGTLAFSPAPGGGRRQIEAQFELAGIRAETLTVASFTPPSARLGRPARVVVRRRGEQLTVSWSRVAGAQRYEIVATVAAGGQRRTTTRARRVTIGRVTRASGGQITVRAVAPMRQGATRRAAFRATSRRAPTRFGPLPRGAE